MDIKVLDLSLVMDELKWILTAQFPTEALEPVREDTETDAAWQQRQFSYGRDKQKYDLDHAYEPLLTRCLAVVKNTIEFAVLDSITDCASVTDCFEKIKNQYTDSQKIYVTQLIKQLFSENIFIEW